jgi:hypothetical protein
MTSKSSDFLQAKTTDTRGNPVVLEEPTIISLTTTILSFSTPEKVNSTKTQKENVYLKFE